MRNRKRLFFVVLGLSIPLAAALVVHAFTLLTLKEALIEVFGKEYKIVKYTKRLTGDTYDKVLERLGGKLVDYQEGSESIAVAGTKKIDFYFAEKDGKKVGVAIEDVEPGKWGPVTFMIAMDLRAHITGVRVMSYEEKRGRPIARRSFMSQYEGKSSSSTLEVGRDITGISGATISSRAATFAVKKAIVLFEEMYLKQ